MSILTRLILLVLVAALPAVGIQTYNEFALRRTGEERVAEESRRLLALIQDEQLRVIEGVREVLATVAEAAPLIGLDQGRCQPFLDRLRARLPRWQSVLMADRDSVVRCATDPALVGAWIGDRAHVQLASTSRDFAIGEYVVRRSNGQPVLPFALPYSDADGQPAGVAVLALDIGWMEDYLARKPLPSKAMLVLADRNGVLLARHPADAGGGVGRPLPPSIMALMHERAAGVAVLPGLDGEERMLAYAPLREEPHDLFLAVGLDAGEALRDVEAASRRGALLLALEMALLLLAAWLGARVFVLRPVARLKAVAGRWRAGDYEARIGLPPEGSEINRLAGAFDRMAEELQARERARDEALAAQRRMVAILSSSNDAVLELDRDGRITFANECAVSLFAVSGRPPPAGSLFADLLPGPVAGLFEERFRHVRDRGEPAEFEARFGPAEAWQSLRVFPTGDRVAVHIQDVTRRKLDERAIHRAEERHRAVLDTAADAMILVDGAGAIRTFNRAAERIFGIAADEAVGRGVRILIPGGLGRVGNEATAGVPSATGEARVIDAGREVEGRCRDGTAVQLEMGLAEWWDGGDRFFTAILRDISERKRTEAALHHAKEMAERANKAKSRFLAAASHDLRQPVQSLFFFATALADQIRGHPGHATLEGMQQALDALKRLLDELLDISKLDAGVVEPVSAVFPLGPILERLAAEYRPQVARKGLELRVAGTSLHVRSDPILLERVVRNLLDNALRYTRDGRILLGVRRAGGHARIVVCDSGIGIPAERQDEIFEEFTQIHNPERDRERGLGLGLAIVRRLCALLGHPVTLRSKPGRGSAFAVDVPRAEAPAAAAPVVAPAAVPEAENRPLVLVIDDEVIILMGLRVMLEGWGYDVIAATSGEEAVALLEKRGRCPDVILADYRLRHGKTGPEALRAIHSHCASPIPSIILTGDTAPERIVEAQKSGFSILHKPVSAHHLRKLVGEAGGR